MSEPTTQAARPPGRGGGKKILGLPRQAVIIGGIALAAGVIWYIYKSRQAASQAATGTSTDTSGAVDYSGDISTLQSEFGQLADELAAMQGGGGGTGSSAGGGAPGVGDGTTGTTGTAATTSTAAAAAAKPKAAARPKAKPTAVPVSGQDAHQKHLAHVAHLKHVAAQKKKPAKKKAA